MLVIGGHIIETPNVIRSRAQETFSHRTMMVDYLSNPNLVVVDRDQTALIKLPDKQSLDFTPV